VQQRRIIVVFALVVALSAAGYGVMFTVLDEMRSEYGIGEGALGLVVAVGFFASFLAQVLLAPFADRGFARRPVLVGMVLEIAGMVTMAFGDTVAALVVARAVMGIGAGMVGPATRRIVILADPDNLGTNIGRLLTADVVGFSLGPAVSAVLVGPLGLAAPFLAIAVLTVVFVPFVLRMSVAETTERPAEQTHFAFDLLRHRAYVAALCLGATVFLMIGTFDVMWVLVLDDLGAADWIANLGIILFAVPLAILGPFGGRLAQRVGPFRTGAIGLLLGAAFMATYGQWTSAGMMLAVSLVHAINDGFTVSSAGVAVAMVAPPGRQAGAQGLLGGVQTLVGGVSAIIAGALYESHGRGIAYGTTAAMMTALVVTALVLVGRDWTQRPAPLSAP
jgi:MFS family permease